MIDGAQEALRELSQHFRLYLITSRQHCIAEETQRWIEEHFAGVFEDMLFGNHYGRSGVKRTKLDMCLEVGAIALVDDSTAYALQCAAELRVRHACRVVLQAHHHCHACLTPAAALAARAAVWRLRLESARSPAAAQCGACAGLDGGQARATCAARPRASAAISILAMHAEFLLHADSCRRI